MVIFMIDVNTNNKNNDGLSFTSKDAPYFIMSNLIESKDNSKQLRVNISECVKQYTRLYHTTNLTTIGFIFEKMTLRSSNLTCARLNDTTERARVGISQFAGSRFITCFSHIDHEIVPFWMNYGGSNPSEKVILKFKNFTNNFYDVINTDYCLLDGDKKSFFYSDEYIQTINQNGVIGEMTGMPKIHLDFDMRNCVRSIEMFDIEYLPVNNEAFSDDYSNKVNIDFSNVINASMIPSTLSNVDMYKPDCLGKQKSNPWEYEGEIRVLCCLDMQDFNEWNFIDLRLKDEIFRDLVIVLSPWLTCELENKIKKIIADCSICDEIKKTITIIHSSLEGTINF